MLLHIEERERHLLLEVLGSTLQTLREVDTPGYERMRQERETLILQLRKRLLAQTPGVLLTGAEVAHARA